MASKTLRATEMSKTLRATNLKCRPPQKCRRNPAPNAISRASTGASFRTEASCQLTPVLAPIPRRPTGASASAAAPLPAAANPACPGNHYNQAAANALQDHATGEAHPHVGEDLPVFLRHHHALQVQRHAHA
jgi:hypothetical protein